jgi:hypothetical protein
MTYKKFSEQLFKWLHEIADDTQIQIVEETESSKIVAKSIIRVNLFTNSNRYRISAVLDENHSYLGCTTSSRKWEPGEDWHRGNDLPDGKFSEVTWNSIKNGILGYELIELEESHRNAQRDPSYPAPSVVGNACACGLPSSAHRKS